MDASDYATEWRSDESGWRVTNVVNGVVGWVVPDGDKFRARAMAGKHWATIWSGNGLKAAVEQVIWYDRAMNQEAE